MDLLQIRPISEKELKRFGLIFGPAALVLSCWQAWRAHWVHVGIFAPLGAYALAMAIFRPGWVFPVRWLLETMVKLVMWAVTNLALIITFYLVFTPIGLILRLAGRDLLNQKRDETETSWQDPDHTTFDPGHYHRQF